MDSGQSTPRCAAPFVCSAEDSVGDRMNPEQSGPEGSVSRHYSVGEAHDLVLLAANRSGTGCVIEMALMWCDANPMDGRFNRGGSKAAGRESAVLP